MKRGYIAGALDSDACGYIKNMNSMILMSEMVRALGVAVFVPCLDFLRGVVMGDLGYDDYFINNSAFIVVCDFMFVCPNSESSKGTQREIEIASLNGIPVFTSLTELNEWLEKKKKEEKMEDIDVV